jgi:putative FmdB family regulatory protein
VPTYQYACKACEHRFDAVQAFSDPSLTECPECGGVLRKLYGSVGVVFKGSGFYRTDSRASSTTADAAATSSSSSSDTKSSDSKSTADSGAKKESTAKPSSSPTGTTTPAKVAS